MCTMGRTDMRNLFQKLINCFKRNNKISYSKPTILILEDDKNLNKL